jgi:hypothetical protein
MYVIVLDIYLGLGLGLLWKYSCVSFCHGISVPFNVSYREVTWVGFLQVFVRAYMRYIPIHSTVLFCLSTVWYLTVRPPYFRIEDPSVVGPVNNFVDSDCELFFTGKFPLVSESR